MEALLRRRVSLENGNDERAISRNRAPATTFCAVATAANNTTSAPPLPSDSMNPGLLDGLIAAEQILRAARGAD